MEKLSKEQVLGVVKRKGPLLPIDVANELRANTIIAGAILSELIKEKQVRISTLKVGGSPVYYTPDQEAKLVDFIYVLKGPEKKVVADLMEKGVLKDGELEPVERVALVNVKDFAKPIDVAVGNEKAKHWKWYLLKNDEVQRILDGIYAPKKEPEKIAEKVPEKPEEIQKKTESVHEKQAEKISEKTEFTEKTVEKPAPKKKRAKKTVSDDKDMRTGQEGHEFSGEKPAPKGEFANKVAAFFSKNNIEIISQKMIKETEIEYNGNMQTAVGKVAYYFIARSKKKISDADLAQVYVKKETVKLPVVFIHNGELTKKAKEMLGNEFKAITVFRIE